jgi:hypothetical protein
MGIEGRIKLIAQRTFSFACFAPISTVRENDPFIWVKSTIRFFKD